MHHLKLLLITITFFTTSIIGQGKFKPTLIKDNVMKEILRYAGIGGFLLSGYKSQLNFLIEYYYSTKNSKIKCSAKWASRFVPP